MTQLPDGIAVQRTGAVHSPHRDSEEHDRDRRAERGQRIGLAADGGDSGAGGTAGAVPAPAVGDGAAGKYLRADGSWVVPPTGSAGAPTGARYLTQLPDGSLPNEQALSTLPTGILKSTTGTGRAECGERIGLAADDGGCGGGWNGGSSSGAGSRG